MKRFFCFTWVFCALSWQCVAATPTDPDAAATIVVFNKRDPVSVDLAGFYAEQRKIPFDHLVGLECSIEEVISREEYDTTIAEPLREIFTSRGWWKLRETSNGKIVEQNKIRYIALIRGMPLKIAPVEAYEGDKQEGLPALTKHNEASIDSELATLGYFSRIISGALTNPYYRSFSRVRDANLPILMLVCRLDAPTALVVRRMILDAVETEARGLWGFAYLDARNITSGGHAEGDKWLQQISDDTRRFGIPTIIDNGPATFPENYPMRHAALYYGWYTANVDGPFLSPDFQFNRGAVAVHIHSFSASTLRSGSTGWAAPLLVKGAAVTLGNVYEPYLGLTPNLDLFQQRLQSGFTFAESAYSSVRVLSWMNTFVGDPLYRPYRMMQDLFYQPPRDVREWAVYRNGARTWFNASPEKAEEELRQAAVGMRSGILAEGLGLLQAMAKQFESCFETFQQARDFYRDPADVLRVSIHEASFLMTTGRKKEALRFVRNQMRRYPRAAAVDVLKLFEMELDPPPPTPPPFKPPTAGR